MGMKAWLVSDKNGDTGFRYIVFAEKRSKAIKLALDLSDGAFDWCVWTDMRAIRLPGLDGFYRGGPMLEWNNMEDRVAMVRYAGFHCSYEVDVTYDECKSCAAHEWCGRFEGMKGE